MTVITIGIVPESLPSPDSNYTSGNDYVVEFLGYRFSFSTHRLRGRVVAAAVKLGRRRELTSSTRTRSPTSSRWPRRA